jgi:hypothetical protein
MASASRNNPTAANAMAVQQEQSGCPPACHASVYDDDEGLEYSPSQHKREMLESEGLMMTRSGFKDLFLLNFLWGLYMQADYLFFL